MATLLTTQAISKHFGTREIFNNLSISFDEGAHVGFLGPNGAGKTTFLKILAGLVHADSGEINRRRSARIRFLPQEDRFQPGDTVESALAAAIADQPLEQHEQETQVNIILSKFGFGDVHRPVEKLSGGWRKRLALAREVIQRPACCCWTSRRITWTSKVFNGLRKCSWAFHLPSWLSATIGIFWSA
jgi:ATP-binding cassette subfamily F protein uup